jgi:hypothetical protein
VDPGQIAQVFEVRSGMSGPCVICEQWRPSDPREYTVEALINHMLGHGLELLHIGQETVWGRDENPSQVTAAILGQRDPG